MMILIMEFAMQAGEAEKQKSYTAICQLPTAVTPEMTEIINSTKDLELHQQTPVRVSHRRADLVRHRTVYAMSCELVPGSPRHLILRLRTQVSSIPCQHEPSGDVLLTVPSVHAVNRVFECVIPAHIALPVNLATYAWGVFPQNEVNHSKA